MLTLTVRGIENPFAATIEKFFHTKFPVNRQNATATLDALTEIVIGTNQVRYGPKPGPESLVSIRTLLREMITLGEPIPVLVPWGSKKPDNDASLDIGEISAVKQMQCFVERVRDVYAPGAVMHVRMEDLGGYYLWNIRNGDATHTASKRYVEEMIDLLRILDKKDSTGRPMFAPFREFDLITYTDLTRVADEFMGPLNDYLRTRFLPPHSLGSFSLGGSFQAMQAIALRKIHDLGWKGDFPEEQLNFYGTQYQRYYPDMTIDLRIEMLARYFAQAAAKSKLRATTPNGAPANAFLAFSFVQPVPGIGDLHDRRVYWRTVPLNQAKTHVPAWRGRGYLKIQGDTIVPKITSWHDPVKESLIPETVDIVDGSRRVTVSTPYLIGA